MAAAAEIPAYSTEYALQRNGANGLRVLLVVDCVRCVVTNVSDGDPWRMEIPPDVHDMLGYLLAIMLDLQRGRKELQYSIADGGKLKTYAFQILGEEQVESPFGRLKTVKLRRTEDKRDTTVWCAPALHYLPVRLEQRETDGSQ